MTSTIKDNFPTRVSTEFKDKKGLIVLNQLRSIDRSRIVQKLSVIEKGNQNNVLDLLSIIFQK